MAVERIGIIGAECTGKSTLAAHLRTLPACVVPEELRAFVEEHGRTPRSDEQAGLLDRQAAAEEASAASCPHDVLVADATALMTAAYSIAYFHDDSLVPRAVEIARGYRLVVWCGTDIPWVGDGAHRDGGARRREVDAIIADIVATELTPLGIRVLHVSGPAASRVEQVRRAWQPLGSGAPT